MADRLAAKGHAVHLVGGDEGGHGGGGAAGNDERGGGGNKWQVEHMRLVMSALNMGLDVLVTSVDALWKGDVTRAADTLLAPEYGMGGYIGREFCSSVLFVRSRPISIAAWSMLVEPGDSSTDLSSMGSEWLKKVEGMDVKFGRLLVHQPTHSVIVLNDEFLPLVVPKHSKTKRDKLQWLRKRRLWWVDDYTLGCSVAVCKRK